MKSNYYFFYRELIQIDDDQTDVTDENCGVHFFDSCSGTISNCFGWCKKVVTSQCCVVHEKMLRRALKITLYIAFNLLLSGIDTGTDIWAAKVHFE